MLIVRNGSQERDEGFALDEGQSNINMTEQGAYYSADIGNTFCMIH
jgi:hypothetical protein